MKVSVLGAQGFIGSNICSSLKINGHCVTTFTNVSVDNIVGKVKAGEFDWVLNFAGQTSVIKSFSDAIGVYKKNIEIALAAMQMASAAGAVLLNTSSYVYGRVEHPPALETDSLNSLNPYMGSKIAIERMLTDLADQLNVGLVTIRPSNVYGYGQREGMLISSLRQSAQDHNEVILNDPDPRRDYLYIADFCRLIARMLDSGSRLIGETFNVGSGVCHSNYEVAQLVREHFAIEAPVKILGNRRTADILDGSLNVTKIKAAVDWEPQYSLAQGIKESMTVESVL
jgi:nucleoside-diphosphate-sugar epimerase